MTTPADDPRAEPPDQPKTTQLPAVPPWAVELMQVSKANFQELKAGQESLARELGADIKLVSNDLGILKDRVGILESARNDGEQRLARTSGGVRQLSTTDAAQAAQLAQARMAREALAEQVAQLTTTQATQLAILTRLDKITTNPTVKVLAGMAATAILTWLASHGVHQ